ncbi:MAG: response regulator [Elusimicrobia bacterium]|nr:response regulator [Elusimicrobiota bacterium]
MTPEKPEPVETWRILVVDDDDEWRGLVEMALRAKGYEVVGAATGEAGVAELRRRPFHVAVLDVKLPGLTGIETLAALKALDPDIEVILATAYHSAAVATEATKRGAYAFLIKPFDMAELEALLPGLSEKMGLKSLVALYETTRTLFAEVQLKDLLPDLMKQAAKVLAADDVSIMLLGRGANLTVAASTSLPLEKWGTVKVPLGGGVAGRVALWQTGVTINGPLECDPRFSDLPSRPEVRYSLVHPILLKKDLIGILSANRKEGKRHFLAQDLRHAAIFCSMIAQAIENAKLYDQLRHLDQLKDEFISTVSHDLRGPLDAITMITDTLDQGVYGPLAQQQKHLVNLIKDSTRHLGVFIQNILDAAKIKAGMLQYVMLDVKPQELVPRLVELFTISAKSKGIVLDYQIPSSLPPVSADPDKLEQILNNLIGNAMKFTPSGGRIRVGVAEDGEFVVFSVDDTGIGIAPEHVSKLFQKFHQVDLERQRDLKIVGTGLGLSICKTIVEGHKGRIWAESAPGKGTIFRFTIPKSTQRAAGSPAARA